MQSPLVVRTEQNLTLPEGASQDWFTTVSQALAASEYNVSGQDGVLSAPNRRQNLRMRFEDDGILVEPRIAGAESWQWQWRLAAWGRHDDLRAITPSRPSADAARVEYRHDGLLEWYANGPEGLEQGFVVNSPPAGQGQLRLTGRLAGNLHGRPTAGGGIDFLNAQGARVLNYDKLRAWDANGRDLPGELVLSETVLSIRIDDAGAVYPVTIDPILTTPDWTEDGENLTAEFGRTVATAGDVNGDGYSDVIIGSEDFSTTGYIISGKAWVYLGSAGGLAADPAWTCLGAHDGVQYGASVACAGDVNNDGYDDIIVGAPAWNSEYYEGRAYVYYGSPGGPSEDDDWYGDGGAVSTYFGQSVSGAGDMNGDGYDDIVVGDPIPGGFASGRVFVWYGSAGGLEFGANNWFSPGATNAWLGWAVSAAGDVNGDGYDDFLAGAPFYENSEEQEGAIYLFTGSATGLAGGTIQIIQGNLTYLHMGYTVGLAGDVNGDGYSDILAGCPVDPTYCPEKDQVRLYRGSATGLETTPAWVQQADENSLGLGWRATTAGDVNGDGYADVLTSAHGYNEDYAGEGKVWLFFGSPSGLPDEAAWEITGGTEDARQAAIATAGDVNGDGFSDIIVGAWGYGPTSSHRGRCYCYLGGSYGPKAAPGWVVEPNQVGALAGFSLAGVGDVNGDGYDDVMVGVPAFDGGNPNEGAAFLYLGSHLGLTWVPLWWAEGQQDNAYFGYSVAGAGDVDGNGLPDLLVGARDYDNGFTNEGAAFLWLSQIGGGPTGTPANAHWSYFGGQETAQFGVSVAGAGDVNGDGYADIIVGADMYDRGTVDEGAVFAFYGSASGPSTSYDWLHDTGSASCRYGYSVAGAGDVNGDGYSDIIVGAPTYDHPEDMEGLAAIYLGSETGLTPGAPWWYAQGDGAGHQLGFSVAGAGDVNGDGFSDWVIGAPFFDGWASNGGAIFLWLGQSTPPPPGTPDNADWLVGRAQANAYCGFSVAGAGDVNGDGYSDVVAGVYGNDGSAGANSGMAFLYFGTNGGLAGGIASWLVEGTQEQSNFGSCVAGGGDVNGDGFSDVLVGAPNHSEGEYWEGRAFLYYGNDSRGLARSPRQWHSDLATRLGPLGMSHSATSFGISVRGRTPAGRGRVRVEYEVKPFGTAFDGTGTVLGNWANTGAPGGAPGSVVDISRVMAGLPSGDLLHWRVRLHSDNPYFPGSPWLQPSWSSGGQLDLRLLDSASPVGSEVPLATGGLGNYPNPFNPHTTFSYDLAERVQVSLQVYDVRGRLVRHLVAEVQDGGRQHVVWDGLDDRGRSLASGTYFAKLQAGKAQFSRKVSLIQ